MKRSFHWPLTLTAAGLAMLAIWPAGSSRAQAGTPGDDGRDGKLQCKQPYEPGKTYTLKQSLSVEAATEESGPDNPVIDFRQIVSAAVKLDETSPGVITARIAHLVQRGNDHGIYNRVDIYADDSPQQNIPGEISWKFKIAFQADIDKSGKLTNLRGAADRLPRQDPTFLNHPAVQAQIARQDDWLCQIVEEPMLYLPPGRVAVGDKWTGGRMIQSFAELYFTPSKDVSDAVECTLSAVADTPDGRVATIDVAGTMGKDEPGMTCFRRSGQIKYNLDAGRLVEHKMTLIGPLIRQGRRNTQLKAVISTSLSPAAPAPAAARQDPPPGLPRLDRDGDDVFVFDRGTKVVQDEAGRVWTLLARPSNPDAAEKQAKMKYPLEMRDPRAGVEGKSPETAYLEMMVDAQGRCWWRDPSNQTTLLWIEDGKYQKRLIGPNYSRRPLPYPRALGVTGTDIFFDAGGEVFAVDAAKLHIYGKGGWKEIDTPCRIEGVRLMDEKVMFRRIGESLYIARNLPSSNSDARGTILVYRDGAVCDTGVLPSQQVAFLGRHEGRLLIGTGNRLWSLDPIPAAAADPKELSRLIEKLFDDLYKVRDEAERGLQQTGQAGIEALQAAIDATDDAERKLRLRTVLKRFKGKPTARLVPTSVGGYEMLDLVFQARGGMQFYRPWAPGGEQAEDLLLCTDGGKELRKVKLPRGGRRFELQLETPDGKIVGRDGLCVFELDPRTLQFRDLFALGSFEGNGRVRVVAVKDGNYCLAVESSQNRLPFTVYFWYSPAGKSGSAMLPGKPIADGVSLSTNYEPDLEIVPDRSGWLWFLRRAGQDRSRLAFAAGGSVTTLEPLLANRRAALLPLKDNAVLIASGNNDPVMLHLGGKVIEKPRLKDLITDNREQMLDLLPEAQPLRAFISWPDVFLLKTGRDIWLKESYVNIQGSGMSIKQFTGVYSGESWQDCDLERVLAVEPDGGKVLAYGENCNRLFWASCKEGNLTTETVTQRDFAFAWCWYDTTDLPYYRSAMILTESAIDKLKDKGTDPEYGEDEDPNAGQFEGCRMWSGHDWVNWEGTLWGGGLYTDTTGGIWSIRQRDILIQLRDGRRQRLDLNDAFDAQCVRLAQERPGVVWLATCQSVVRLVSDPTEGVYGPYRVDRRFSTRNYGYGIRGPWIVGEKDFYFAAGGVLYHTTLAELLKDSKPAD